MKRKANFLTLWRRKQSVRPEDFYQREADPEAELEATLINFHIQENKKAHKTNEYEIEQLVLRRGQVFDLTIKFNREYKPDRDVFALLFITDENFDQKKVAIVRLEFCNALLRSEWGMQIKEANGNTVRLSVMSSDQATAGYYNVRVETKSQDSFGETSLYQLKNGQQICFVEEN